MEEGKTSSHGFCIENIPLKVCSLLNKNEFVLVSLVSLNTSIWHQTIEGKTLQNASLISSSNEFESYYHIPLPTIPQFSDFELSPLQR